MLHALRAAAPRAVLGLALAAVFASSLPGPTRAAGITIVVDTTADDVDANGGNDLVCATAAGKCSLRAAIQTANLSADADTITVPAGTYTVDLGPYDGNDVNASNGDLDIRGSVTIKGAGASSTVIQASATNADAAIDRVFDLVTPSINVTISGVTIRYGKGTNFGGGISVSSSNAVLNLNAVVLDRNKSVQTGGAISGGGTLTITNSTLKGNTGSSAAAIEWAGNATIKTTSITGNTATSNIGIGGIWLFHLPAAQGSTFLIDRSLISGNTGGYPAVYLSNGSQDTSITTIRNSTIAGNTATGSDASIIGMDASATLHFESSTIASNAAYRVIYPSSKAKITAKNTIFGKNGASNCDSAITSLGNNIDYTKSCGLTTATDKQGTAPLLGALAANGGPTKTMALAATSPAIDAGAGCPSIDQRGQSRPKDGNGDGTAACDIGAYESKAVAVVATPSPSAAPTEAPSPTPEITAEPSAAPTEPPAETPSAAPTEAASAAPSAEASPVASAAPSGNAGDTSGGGGLIPLLAVLVVVIVGVVAFALGRRGRSSSGGNAAA